MSDEFDSGLALTSQERNSTLWAKIQAHLQNRLHQARLRNDSNLSAEDTAKLRGRISELKDLLATGEIQD